MPFAPENLIPIAALLLALGLEMLLCAKVKRWWIRLLPVMAGGASCLAFFLWAVHVTGWERLVPLVLLLCALALSSAMLGGILAFVFLSLLRQK